MERKTQFSVEQIYNELWSRHWRKFPIPMWVFIQSFVPYETRNNKEKRIRISSKVSTKVLLDDLYTFLPDEVKVKVEEYRKNNRRRLN
jgi:hypothetical protein